MLTADTRTAGRPQRVPPSRACKLAALWLAAVAPAAIFAARALPAARAAAGTITTITDGDFRASAFPFNQEFFGTTPDPDKAGLSCALDASRGETCFYRADDAWLRATLPTWKAPAGAISTRPWTNGFSTPRLLGGIATHNKSTGTYTPDLDFEVVTRGADGTLVHNFTRIDVTIDGWLRAAKTERFLIVLDNIPYAFVKPANRYYLGFGMGAAPDDPLEFAAFVGTFASHLVARYGLATVSTWRFRLGTECDGPRIGHSWLNFTAPNPPFVMADGHGGNYTSRVNGLEKYTQTYFAVAKALKAVVPKAAFGPSNMAGIAGDVNAGAGGGGSTELCTSCKYLDEFADRARAAAAPVDFVAASEYSKWDALGLAPCRPMADTIEVLGKFARRATGVATTPIEVHEWGWASWGDWAADCKANAPMGAWAGAWDLGSYLYQRVGGASRVFHWGYAEDNSLNRGVRGRGGNASQTCVPGTTWKQDCRTFGYPLITPHGWLLTALLHVAPGSPSSPGFRLDEFVFDIPVPVRGHPHRNRGKETSFNHTIGAVRSLGPGAASSSSSSASASRAGPGGVLLQYLVLNYSPNSTEHARRRFRIEVSAADVAAVLGGHVAAGGGCGALAVTQQAMNRTTATHDLIEQRLFETRTKVGAELRSVDVVGSMATAQGLTMLTSNAAEWMRLNREMLQFGPFDGQVGDGGAAGGGCALEFTLETPSMLLLRLEKSEGEPRR